MIIRTADEDDSERIACLLIHYDINFTYTHITSPDYEFDIDLETPMHKMIQIATSIGPCDYNPHDNVITVD